MYAVIWIRRISVAPPLYSEVPYLSLSSYWEQLRLITSSVLRGFTRTFRLHPPPPIFLLSQAIKHASLRKKVFIPTHHKTGVQTPTTLSPSPSQHSGRQIQPCRNPSYANQSFSHRSSYCFCLFRSGSLWAEGDGHCLCSNQPFCRRPDTCCTATRHSLRKKTEFRT